MRRIFCILIFTIFSVLFGCSTIARNPSSLSHFVSTDEKPLPEYEWIWTHLKQFYGEAMPQQVKIVFTNAGVSRFDTENFLILLDKKIFQDRGAELIAHETSHLCLFLLTKGMSNQEKFRFMDEGFAEIISHEILGNLDQYKRSFLLGAAIQLKKSNISITKVQNWSVYFGNSQSANWYAYDVGASFNFYIKDQYNEKKLKALFIDFGKTKNLELSTKNILGKNISEIEVSWKDYLFKVPLSYDTPQIISSTPRHNEINVSPDLKEISVTFSVPMDVRRKISVMTNCDEGVCYKNVYWKDPMTLSIGLPNKLLSNHQYDLQLGKKDNPLQSVTDISFPITKWRFKTK